MTIILLNRPMCDYLTLTSFDDLAYAAFKDVVNQLADKVQKTYEHNLMQYVGLRYEAREGGGVFIGTAKFGSRTGAIMSASGAVSDFILRWALKGLKVGYKATRIDLQMTVSKNGWHWPTAEKTMNEAGKVTSRISSATGTTLYIGSWKSEKFTRIYEKTADDGDKLVRFESVYKGDSATAVLMQLSASLLKVEDEIGGMLRHRVIVASNYIADFWEPFFIRFRAFEPKRVRTETNTEKWLRETVLKSLSKYAFSHDADISLLNEFKKVIDYAVGEGE